MYKKIAFILIIVLATAAAGFVLGDFIYSSRRFPPNTFIENIEVSGLSVGEVIRILSKADVDSSCAKNIMLFSSSEVYEFVPSEIGSYIKPRSTAYSAFKAAYKSNYLKSLVKRVIGLERRKVLTLRLGVDNEVAGPIVKDIAGRINVASVEARCILLGEGKYKLTDEKIGSRVDEPQTILLLGESLALGRKTSPLIIVEDPPRVFRADLEEHPPIHSIGRYRTRYGYHDDPNRIHNIKLLSSVISNHIILPDETFSFLKAAGDISGSKGYKEALVIVGGELMPQYGGGACQVATTLYNAAMYADLDILRRRNHAIYFFIYPLGRDAAIYPDSLDMKFKNNTGHPVMVRTYATGSSLTIALYGTPTGKTVSFSTAKIIERRPGLFSYEISRDKFDFNVPFTTIVEKFVHKNGKLISSKEIKSHYSFAGESENGRTASTGSE